MCSVNYLQVICFISFALLFCNIFKHLGLQKYISFSFSWSNRFIMVVTIAPRVPITELSLRAGCISNLKSTVVFKKLHLKCFLSLSMPPKSGHREEELHTNLAITLPPVSHNDHLRSLKACHLTAIPQSKWSACSRHCKAP